MTQAPVLTDEQRIVVEQPADAQLLVTAEAGSGKTLCVVHRLEFLIQGARLEAAEMLVLTFSRAAVRALRERLAKYGDAGRHVGVRTFDSYATWLLAEFEPDGTWLGGDYEERIAAATRLLDSNLDGPALVSHIRHLVVDEVQDLVGPRAELAKALIRRISGGFTLLGDPSQGIYGFQLKTIEERLRGSAALYEWLRASYTNTLVERELKYPFRAREPEAAVARAYGPLLADADADFGGIQRGLRTTLLKSHSLGTLSDAIPILAELQAPTAVLCRNNGQALLISRELHRFGIPHRLQRSAQDRAVPGWIGHLYRRLESKRPARTEVAEFLEAAGLPVDETWMLLKRMDGNRRNPGLDLTSVRDRLASRNVPDELVQQLPATLVVSTIHRAKGLEFDQVVILDPEDSAGDQAEHAEAARTLYVGMTRPRDMLMHLKPLAGLTKGKLIKLGQRWTDCGYWKYRNSRFGMEVGGEDIHCEDPAGTRGFTDDPTELQEYLIARVRPGNAVTLVPVDETTAESAPTYALEHEDRTIGITSDKFARALRAVLPGRQRDRWPDRIDDIRIDCIETVVGTPAASINANLGWSGVWVRPRLTGLARFDWGKKSRS